MSYGGGYGSRDGGGYGGGHSNGYVCILHLAARSLSLRIVLLQAPSKMACLARSCTHYNEAKFSAIIQAYVYFGFVHAPLNPSLLLHNH